MAVVTELVCYPVKGCAGVVLDETPVAAAGLAHDRAFMVTGEDGVFRSQRRDPRLAVVQPGISPDGTLLTLRVEGLEPLAVEVDTHSPARDVELFGVPYRGIDQGDAAAEWLSEALGRRSRLVRVPPEHDRVTDGRTPGTAGYADSGAVHVISAATLDLLNRRLAEAGAPPVPMRRFRPNIVVAGWPAPHHEDTVDRLTAGDAGLAFAKLAIRCAVTLVDQDTGRKAGPEPLRTLAAYRRAVRGVAFGAKFSVVRPGKVTVGDEVTVSQAG